MQAMPNSLRAMLLLSLHHDAESQGRIGGEVEAESYFRARLGIFGFSVAQSMRIHPPGVPANGATGGGAGHRTTEAPVGASAESCSVVGLLTALGAACRAALGAGGGTLGATLLAALGAGRGRGSALGAARGPAFGARCARGESEGGNR